jgi:hypothetical protein
MAEYYEYSWHLGTEYLGCEPPYDYERGWEFKSKSPLKAKMALKYDTDHRNILEVYTSATISITIFSEDQSSPKQNLL